MALYIIGIGGTGSKCLEAIIHASASGIFTQEKIKILFVDADKANGNLNRTRNTLKYYQNCYKRLQKSSVTENNDQSFILLKTPIEDYGDVWSPLDHSGSNSDKNLTSFFGYNTLKQSNDRLGNLFDVLYTQAEREANLDIGFRGIPAIGSAVMSQVDLNSLSDEPWSSLIKEIKSDNQPKILLCGSIFGGTGASGLPTISRMIHQKLQNENLREKVKIGAVFLLPYFGFTPPDSEEDADELYAREEDFLLNTDAALRYYANQSKQFDRVYLLGNQNRSEYKRSLGKNTQRNAPHFIELYAALAARDFLINSPKILGEIEVVVISRNKTAIKWEYIPNNEEKILQKSFQEVISFASVWLGDISQELVITDNTIDEFINTSPWIKKFFAFPENSTNSFLNILFKTQPLIELPKFQDKSEQQGIEEITQWCRDYLTWIIDLHEKSADNIQLVNVSDLKHLIDNSKTDQNSEWDIVTDLKNQLNYITASNSGAAGLAKALFMLCLKNYVFPFPIVF